MQKQCETNVCFDFYLYNQAASSKDSSKNQHHRHGRQDHPRSALHQEGRDRDPRIDDSTSESHRQGWTRFDHDRSSNELQHAARPSCCRDIQQCLRKSSRNKHRHGSTVFPRQDGDFHGSHGEWNVTLEFFDRLRCNFPPLYVLYRTYDKLRTRWKHTPLSGKFFQLIQHLLTVELFNCVCQIFPGQVGWPKEKGCCRIETTLWSGEDDERTLQTQDEAS